MEHIIGWNSTNEIFRNLIEITRPKVIIEVGSWHGKSTIHMAKICREMGLGTKIYCVDTWLGAIEFYTNPTPERDLLLKDGYPQVFYKFLENIRNESVDDMIVPIPLPSNMAHKILPNADLIYIDGSHEYEDVKSDIEIYRKKLNQNGMMFGDDYGNTVFPGVKKAVDEVPSIIVERWFWIFNGIIK
jgi:cephalosporin hydroxylase